MKTKLLISVLVWFLITAFYFFETGNKQSINQTPNTNTDSLPFLIGTVSNGAYKDFAGYENANINLWHLYSSYQRVGNYVYPVGWVELGATNDSLFKSIDSYGDQVRSILQNNANHGMYSYMMRPKIEYVCYGQRSDYQCEKITKPSNPSTDNTDWFYSYNTHETGDTASDGQETPVMFCDVNNSGQNAGYVVKNLRTNRELCNTIVTNLTQDDAFDWYVLPKIRIPQGTSDNARVCKIEIINWKDSTLKYWDLNGRDFKDNSGYYAGGYISEFNINQNGFNPLKLDTSVSHYFNPDKKGWTDVNEISHFDIRVYWYKECNMWIDYVRVENNIAYYLLTDTTSNTHNTYVNWIRDETQQIASDPSLKPYKFYVEEVEYNHLPCIKYVNQKIMEYNPNMSVKCVPYLCVPPMNGGEWYWFTQEKVKAIYDSTHLKEYYVSAYPLHGDGNSMDLYSVHSYIPNTFDTCDYDMSKGRLGVSASVETYEANLQDLLDNHDLFIDNILKTANYVSKSLDIPIIFLQQAHLWLTSSTSHQDEAYSHREPTNQELEVMGCIGISYGAKGLSYFAADSWGTFALNSSTQTYQYGRGLWENHYSTNDTLKRYLNVYGQNKWNKVVELNRKYKKWGPYLMQFDINDTKSCSYSVEAERNTFITNTYFSNIITYIPGSGEPACTSQNPGGNLPTGLTYECNDDRYLQAATFKSTTSDVDKYFMIVNRRCSPYIDESSPDNRGGKRNIRVKFDLNSSDFAAHNNWDIFCIDSNKIVAKFDPSAGTLIDLGWFMPGQGELYRISPTVLNGGTLVADETISGNVNCNGMIYNGGHNITISPNAVVTFSDSAGIEMNGGCFVSGVNADNADAVTLTGKSSNTFWKGITLIGCDSIGVYNTNISNIKANDTAKAYSIINSYKVNFRRNTINANSNSGGIQAVYNSFSDIPIVFNVRECTFNMNYSGYSAISVLSNASVTLPLFT